MEMNNNNNSYASGGGGVGGNGRSGDPSGTIRYVAEVRENDVLWPFVYHRLGNAQFRKLVWDRVSEYNNTGIRAIKLDIINNIADSVFNRNGRFIRQVNAAEAEQLGVPKGTTAWVLMGQSEVIKKIRKLFQNIGVRANPSAITVPRPGDVLWQNMTVDSQHVGNVHFRTMVAAHAADFRNSAFKKEIVKSISDSISYSNGRFLREISTLEDTEQIRGPEGSTAWILVDQSSVNQLIQQALDNHQEDTVASATSSSCVLPTLDQTRNGSAITLVGTFDVVATLDADGVDPYPSNLQFQLLLASVKKAFCAAKTSKRERRIAMNVVSCLSNRNGRFLRKINNVAETSWLHNSGLNVWIRIEHNTAIEMTLQALRSLADRSTANGGTDGETSMAFTPASQPTQSSVHSVTNEPVNGKRASDNASFAGTTAELPRHKQRRILPESIPKPSPREEAVAAHPSTGCDTPLSLHYGPTNALGHDGDEMPTDHGALMDENGDPADFGIEETVNASDTNMDNLDVELDSTSLLDKQEQAQLQMSDVAYSTTLNGQESSHATQEHEKAMSMAPSKSTAPLLESNVNRADAPTFLPADTGRSQEDGSDSGSDGIQPEEAPTGEVMPASAQNDAPAEDLERNDEGLNFCLSRMRSIGVRNSRLLAKHSNLFNQLEWLYTDPTIQSALPDDFVRNGRTFKIEQIPTPTLHEGNDDGDDGDEGEQWLRWLACVIIQNARLRSTIEGQESKIQDLCEYKQQLDQAKSEADELQRQLEQLKTKTEACREAVVARLLAK